MTDLVIASNKTSQLLNTLIDSEVADLSYSVPPSYPLLAKQVVEINAENSVSGAIDGKEVTFKINRSQLVRNMAIKTFFTTTGATAVTTSPLGLNLFQWIQLKSQNKVLMTLSDASIRSRVDDSPVEAQTIMFRRALPLDPDSDRPPVSETTLDDPAACYTPIFSAFFEKTENNLDLSFYEQLNITAKYNDLARTNAGTGVTAITLSDAKLYIWSYIPDQKYLDVLRSRNQVPSKPLSMLGYSTFTERKTCTSVTNTKMRLNVNHPVYKTFINVRPIIVGQPNNAAITKFTLSMGGVQLLNDISVTNGRYESEMSGAGALIVSSDSAVSYHDDKSICLDWGLLPQEAHAQCGGAVSFSNINYPEIDVTYGDLTANGGAAAYEVQVVHWFYQIYTMSSSDGSVEVSVRS